MRSKLVLAGVAVCLASGAIGAEVGLYIDRRPTDREVSRNYTGAKFEPPWGCYLGAYISLDRSIKTSIRDELGRQHRSPEEFESIVGKRHATYFFYMGYGTPLALNWIEQVAQAGRVVHIALEPNNGLQLVRDDRYLRLLADDLRATGARVFLRFASEMNGPWVAYGRDPAQYREKFRLVARVMHDRAPNVAMVWCPYAMPAKTIDRYYPGDDAVDWVGVNMYNVTYFNQNPSTPGWQVHPCDMLDTVYDRYAAKKPVMIGEYGATHFSAVEGEKKTQYAVRCIKSLYMALPRLYPRVKAVTYFNGNNLELNHAKNNNYAVTQDPVVLSTYRAVVQPAYFLEQAVKQLQGRKYVPPVSPMPVRNGEVLLGRVKLSAWAKDTDSLPRMKYFVNGRHVGGTEDGDWQRTMDTRSWPAGSVRLTVEAWVGGRKVGATTRMVTVHRVAS